MVSVSKCSKIIVTLCVVGTALSLVLRNLGLIHSSSGAGTATSTSVSNDDSWWFPTNVSTAHVLYDDLRYRRVCELVHDNKRSPQLCMIVRYPFPLPLQDPNYTFAYPIDDRFYSLTAGVIFIDGDDLSRCEQLSVTNNTFSSMTTSTRTDDELFSEQVRNCLEDFAAQRSSVDQDKAAYAVWTRQYPRQASPHFFGIQKHEQQNNIDKFFHNQVIVVVGASPTPWITMELYNLFGDCKIHINNYITSALCFMHDRNQSSPWQPWDIRRNFSLLEDDQTFILSHRCLPEECNDIFASLEKIGFSRASSGVPYANDTAASLRKVTFIIEYPIAHLQVQESLLGDWNKTVQLQKDYISMYMQLSTSEGKAKLRALGWELDRIIQFDGKPQGFPTVTGGFINSFIPLNTEEKFLKAGGYPGWHPELGSKCRGPLPPATSLLTRLNSVVIRELARVAGVQWYGRTWEFTTQFWFEFVGYMKFGIDCTHTQYRRGNVGMDSVHKYFLQAMVDVDYYYEHPNREKKIDK